MSYTYWFSDRNATDIALVGGKGANLSRLVAGGFPVPPGFCVSSDAYRYLLKVTGLDSVINDLVSDINFEDTQDVGDKAAGIRDLIEQQPIPQQIADEIQFNYEELGRRLGCRPLEDTPVAVRSSATAEDLPQASFAGQQDTYLNIRGGSELLEHVRRCWASLWTDRALTYRHRQEFDHDKVYVAVVVQAMVDPVVSGILFTANPVSGDRDHCVINASWGLGEAIVSGLVNPDTLVVNKSDGRILQQEITTKDRRIIFSPHSGAIEEDVPPELQRQSALRPQQAADLVALATRIEEYYGTPQDIEWARQAGNWYILQARPITTLKKNIPENIDSGTYSRAMFVEIFPDGLSPSFLSVVHALLDQMLRVAFNQLGFRDQPAWDGVRAINNQPYLSIDFIEETLQDVDPALRHHLVARFSNIFNSEQENDQSLSLAQVQLVLRLFGFVRRFQRELPGLLSDYHAEIEQIIQIDPASVSDAELLRQVRHICENGAGPLLNNDFLLIATIGVYRTLLTRLLKGDASEKQESLAALLGGISGNVVMETNMMIWDLAQKARATPAVLQIIQENDPAQIIHLLQEVSEAQFFLDLLHEVLSVCGHREQRFDILYPTWGEDPAPIFAFIQGYLAMPDPVDPQIRKQELVQRREAATARAVHDLSRSWLGRFVRRPLFNILLKQTQWLARERDTMHFEWTRIFPPARRMQLEIGRRWQAMNIIDQPQDIFFLELEEQEQVAVTLKPCQDLIRERRAVYETNLSGPWPELIVAGRAAGSQSETFAVEISGTDAAINGIPGSAGQATGPVRIIAGPQDFSHLQSGDILVAPMTNPVWTPLFALASGIVTEVGGVLSHGAIVAREYGIPAVMSVTGATGLFEEGEIVTVDGSRGRVIRE